MQHQQLFKVTLIQDDVVGAPCLPGQHCTHTHLCRQADYRHPNLQRLQGLRKSKHRLHKWPWSAMGSRLRRLLHLDQLVDVAWVTRSQAAEDYQELPACVSRHVPSNKDRSSWRTFEINQKGIQPTSRREPTWGSARPGWGSYTGTALRHTPCPQLSSEQQNASLGFLLGKKKEDRINHKQTTGTDLFIGEQTTDLGSGSYTFNHSLFTWILTWQVSQLLSSFVLRGDNAHLKTEQIAAGFKGHRF